MKEALELLFNMLRNDLNIENGEVKQQFFIDFSSYREH